MELFLRDYQMDAVNQMHSGWVYLAKHGSKKTRKKNFHRAIRILEER